MERPMMPAPTITTSARSRMRHGKAGAPQAPSSGRGGRERGRRRLAAVLLVVAAAAVALLVPPAVRHLRAAALLARFADPDRPVAALAAFERPVATRDLPPI